MADTFLDAAWQKVTNASDLEKSYTAEAKKRPELALVLARVKAALGGGDEGSLAAASLGIDGQLALAEPLLVARLLAANEPRDAQSVVGVLAKNASARSVPHLRTAAKSFAALLKAAQANPKDRWDARWWGEAL